MTTPYSKVRNYIKRKREVYFIEILEKDLASHIQEVTDGNMFMYWPIAEQRDALPTDRRLLIEILVRELQRREKEKQDVPAVSQVG